jgi:putative transcriptional regulator
MHIILVGLHVTLVDLHIILVGMHVKSTILHPLPANSPTIPGIPLPLYYNIGGRKVIGRKILRWIDAIEDFVFCLGKQDGFPYMLKKEDISSSCLSIPNSFIRFPLMADTQMNRIKEVLKEQGRTQTWLAEKINKSYVVVTNYCNNNKQPSIEVLRKIAQTLDVDVRELLVPTKK